MASIGYNNMADSNQCIESDRSRYSERRLIRKYCTINNIKQIIGNIDSEIQAKRKHRFDKFAAIGNKHRCGKIASIGNIDSEISTQKEKSIRKDCTSIGNKDRLGFFQVHFFFLYFLPSHAKPISGAYIMYTIVY